MKGSTLRFQRTLVLVSVGLFVIKLTAWILTGSVAILTDALESIVNVIAGFLGWYSLYLSSKPKDREHPYGHGKVEFITSAFEGILISVAGIAIIYEAILNLYHPHVLKQLDYGIVLIGITAVINYVLGFLSVKRGKLQNSPVLISTGEHLKSDTYSTAGLMIGVAAVWLTNYQVLDSVVAIIFAFVILFTGYKIIRKSLSGIMDEADQEIIQEVVEILNANRDPAWVDVHNLRVIDYAGFYHIDCHLTVPYYFTVDEAHAVMDKLTRLFHQRFDNRVEFFIHADGCLFEQCSLCERLSCTVRKLPFQRHLLWTMENIQSDAKHRLPAMEMDKTL